MMINTINPVFFYKMTIAALARITAQRRAPLSRQKGSSFMRLRIASLILLMAASSSVPAVAQDAMDDPRTFNVTANFQVQVPVDAAAQTADMAKAIAQVSQQLGDLANRECDVLSSTFKAECHVAQLNMGANINERRNRQNSNGGFAGEQKTITANLNATYALTPHADAAKPSSTPAQ